MRGAMGVALAAALLTAPAMAQGGGLTGYWQGKYDCAQGVTGVTLTIRETMDAEAEGLFLFYAVSENPGVPTGCYRLRGRYDPATREVRLVSDESQWLWRPENYVTVNFVGRMEASGGRMRGIVEGPGCTAFDLRRVADAPPAPEPCTRAMHLSRRGGGGGALAAVAPPGAGGVR
ncbi:MAG: hypothetical protein IPK81_21720 [Rhodospirillales bacterium]|nr:MAG: hypothetical protein IPK81_21720 [Rhodospirillales bacterium]